MNMWWLPPPQEVGVCCISHHDLGCANQPKFANNLYVLESSMIWRTEEMHPNKATTLNKIMMNLYNQNLNVRGEGLKVAEYKTKGNTKSRGVKPTAPIKAAMSPKKGMAAAMKVDNATKMVRRMARGKKLRMEFMPIPTSDDIPSNISNVGCEYTCNQCQPYPSFKNSLMYFSRKEEDKRKNTCITLMFANTNMNYRISLLVCYCLNQKVNSF